MQQRIEGLLERLKPDRGQGFADLEVKVFYAASSESLPSVGSTDERDVHVGIRPHVTVHDGAPQVPGVDAG